MTTALFFIGFIAMMIALPLAIYLHLRIDALRRTGDLPADTPDLFGWGYGGLGPSLSLLFSRSFREVDGHTRRLVPIVRLGLTIGSGAVLVLFGLKALGLD